MLGYWSQTQGCCCGCSSPPPLVFPTLLPAGPQEERSIVLFSQKFFFHVTFTFTLRLSSHYQVYFHFLHHHQPLNHLRMEVNEFSNLSLFTLNVNSTMLRWRKPREWKKQPCTSRRLWQSTSLLSRFSRYLRSWNPYFLQCFGVIVSVPLFQRNPKNLFLLVSYNIKSSGTGTRGVKAWGWPWWGRQGRAKAGKATGKNKNKTDF